MHSSRLSPDAESLWENGILSSDSILNRYKHANQPDLSFMSEDLSTGDISMDSLHHWIPSLDISPLVEANFAMGMVEHAEVFNRSMTEKIELSEDISPLKQKNPVPSDGLVVLIPEGHLYLWRTSHQDVFRRGLTTSVSSVYAMAETPFASDIISHRTAASNVRKAGVEDEYGRGVLCKDHQAILEKQFGMFDAKALAASWSAKGQAAAALGTMMHGQIERYYETGAMPAEITPEFAQFLDFASYPAHGRDFIYRTELTMMFAPLLMTGQADALFRVEGAKDEFDLYDWKRVGNIDKSVTLTSEFRDAFPNANRTTAGKYFRQLNLYRFMAEQMGLKIRNMYICVFYPGRTWEKIPVPLLIDETIWLLERLEKHVHEKLT